MSVIQCDAEVSEDREMLWVRQEGEGRTIADDERDGIVVRGIARELSTLYQAAMTNALDKGLRPTKAKIRIEFDVCKWDILIKLIAEWEDEEVAE